MSAAPTPDLAKRLVAEGLGTGLLVAVVVGSGIMAETLSSDVGIQLLANALATVFGLAVLILVLGPVSGAHFNPVVSLADWWVGRRGGEGAGLGGGEVAAYSLAQTAGALLGAVLANAMFDLAPLQVSTKERSDPSLWLSEVVATTGLLLLILSLVRTQRTAVVAPAVGAYIGAAYWFTASTSFANPAVTVGRTVSDTFAGIDPASVPAFVLAQLVGAAVGTGLALWFHPSLPEVADDVVVPHPAREEHP